ncbi:DUF1330 domain-containing protein [Actinomadura sp. NPDC047616]|uniref:DUF1330 domain-containing protein n=1 Tax=Actinomadura sp. NPDC047616 TaxID=3155914 RepID=UPI0034076161
MRHVGRGHLAAAPRPRLLHRPLRAWYESAAYERAKPPRQAAADTNAVIVSGFEMPR